MPRRTRQTDTAPPGFTLIEMLVVVVVLGIAAALVVPRIGSADTTKLRSAANILTADLAMAQSESMAHPDEPRMLDWLVAGGFRYNLETADDDGAANPDQLITHPVFKTPYQVYYGQNAAYDQLQGVWLAKSNLWITDHNGHVHFGMFGHVSFPAYDPVMVLAAGDSTLTVTVDATTGQANIANDFVPLSDLNTITMPGPSGNVYTQATAP